MTVAVMQPYLFPYLGYYQLVYSAHQFVIYDEVNYIKRGYINRNNILVNNKSQRFTVPVLSASQNKKITELNFSSDVSKVLRTMSLAYAKAPYFKEVYPLIESTLQHENRSITAVCKKGLCAVFDYLDIKKNIVTSSELDYERSLSPAQRLVDITRGFDSQHYINSVGGKALYTKQDFKEQGVKLSFLETNQVEYAQPTECFLANLSIIDVLMWCKKSEVRQLLAEYQLT